MTAAALTCIRFVAVTEKTVVMEVRLPHSFLAPCEVMQKTVFRWSIPLAHEKIDGDRCFNAMWLLSHYRLLLRIE